MATKSSCMAGCAGKTALFLLVFFNIIFSLCGLAILGVGIWIRVDPAVVQILDLVNLDKDNPNLVYAAYIMMAFGGIMLLIAVFGCCGGIHKNRCLLGLYITALIFVFCGQIAAGVLAGVYKNDVERTIEANLLEVLNREYRPGRTKYTQPWDYAQVLLECCGVKNYTDYRKIELGENNHVPVSCCKLSNDNPDDPRPVNNTQCQKEALQSFPGIQLHPGGCVEGVTNRIKEYDAVLIGVAVGLAAVEILGVILACCVCKNIKSENFPN